MTLRVDLWDWNDENRQADYSNFNVADADDFYRLTFDSYSGTAGIV